MEKSSSASSKSSTGYVETVGEIMKLYKSVPPRPSIEEVEAAVSVITEVDREEQERIEEINGEEAPQDVPAELFSVLQEVKKSMVVFKSLEQRKEAIYLVEIDKIFQRFDDLIQRTSELISGDRTTDVGKGFNLDSPDGEIGKEVPINDDESATTTSDDTEGFLRPAFPKHHFPSSVLRDDEDGEKLSLMRVAAIFEKSAKDEVEVLDFHGKLMDKIEWLPVSLGKLLNLVELNVAENQIMALPTSIGNLKKLRKFDIHANQLINLPDSFGELVSLTDLDLHANRLKSLPDSFKNLRKLINLDLSSNRYIRLPDTIGNLISLEKLNVGTNDLEELPYTIGWCSSLIELRLDFNQLKALPESMGKLSCLEILTLHYNRIKRLPTTMGNVLHLKELVVSFNELESIPESLCFAGSLRKLNVGNNFSDFRALPDSIGNLKTLEELDISGNQVRTLPESFRFLSNLQVFHADETPLEIPPRELAKQGAQAVVKFMAEFVTTRDTNLKRTAVERRGICELLARCLGIENLLNRGKFSTEV